MPKVIVLTTGGTIGHRSQAGVAVMDFDPSALASQLSIGGIDLRFRPVFAKGSMEIVPGDWVALAGAVAGAAAEKPAGVVILHGTDTMHYSAAALAFMLGDLPFPVVLTGSMRPGGDPDSDAVANLRDAVRVAAAADLAEVCIVFSADAARSRAVIIRGTRAHKIRSFALDAFDSINAPPIGFVEGEAVAIAPGAGRRRGAAALRLATEIEQNVVLLKMTPALTAGVLARQLQDMAGAVVEGTGIGHIRSDLQGVVADFGKPVVVGTQALYGGERLGLYDADRAILGIANVIPAGDMTSETAMVKLMWALGRGGDVRSIMRANIAGELSRPGADWRH